MTNGADARCLGICREIEHTDGDFYIIERLSYVLSRSVAPPFSRKDSASLASDQSQVGSPRCGRLAAVAPVVESAVPDSRARPTPGLDATEQKSGTHHQGYRGDHCQRDQHLAGPDRLNWPGMNRPEQLGNLRYECQNLAHLFSSLAALLNDASKALATRCPRPFRPEPRRPPSAGEFYRQRED